MDKVEDHPIVELFPMLTDEQLADLTEDIRKHGLKQPITLYEGKILDGRNRYRACQAAGTMPRFDAYIGTDPVGHVLSLNLHRRHLSLSQIAAVIGVKALPHYEEEAKKRQQARTGNQPGTDRANLPYLEKSKSTEQAAKALGISPRLLSDAKRLSKTAAREYLGARLRVDWRPMPLGTFDDLMRRRAIPYMKSGRARGCAVTFSEAELEAYLATCERRPAAVFRH